MNKCPNCKKPTISTWKMVTATKAFPVKCPECNELSFLPTWWHVGSVLSMEVVLWGSIIISIILKNWFALLILPMAIAFFYLMSKKVALVSVTVAQVKSERKLMVMVILAITLSVFTYQVIVR